MSGYLLGEPNGDPELNWAGGWIGGTSFGRRLLLDDSHWSAQNVEQFVRLEDSLFKQEESKEHDLESTIISN